MNMPARICAAKPQPFDAEAQPFDAEGLTFGMTADLRDLPMPHSLGVRAIAGEVVALTPAAAPALALSPAPARTGIIAAPSARDDSAAFALLDREERLIILLSRGSSRLSALGGRLGGLLSGGGGDTDPDLRTRHSALRRFAILYRLDRGGLAFREDERLAEAGYSEDQAAVIRALVERFDESWSPPPRSWVRMLVVFLLAAGGAALLYRRLATGIDDLYVASLLSIVIVTGIMSFFAVTARPGGGSSRPKSSTARK